MAIKELETQIDEIRNGSIEHVITEYGHASAAITQVGQQRAYADGNRRQQISAMRKKTRQEVIKYGPGFLEFMSPQLRALITPNDLEQLIEEHKRFLVKRERDGY